MAFVADPSITVVVATFNAGPILSRCLDSVLDQDYGFVDLVVIDGGSTDGTIDRIRGYGGRIAHWESSPDNGVYDAWNKALRHVRGEWVCFLGADDRLAAPDALSKMAPHLGGITERVVYGITLVKDARDQVTEKMGMPWLPTRVALESRMALPNPSTFYHREVFERHGPFDATFKIAGDYEMLLRELRDGSAVFVDTVVTIMGAGGMSQDPRNWPRSLREAARARRMNGFRSAPDWRSFAIYEAFAYAGVYRLLGPKHSMRLWIAYRGALDTLRTRVAKTRH